MKTKKQIAREEKIKTFLKSLNTEVQILDYIDIEQVNNYEDIETQISDNNGFDIEIIYYSNAIEYLKNNDSSLRESIEIAVEYGFELKNLSSEVLASLLASRNAREEFYEKKDEIDEFFVELNN